MFNDGAILFLIGATGCQILTGLDDLDGPGGTSTSDGGSGGSLGGAGGVGGEGGQPEGGGGSGGASCGETDTLTCNEIECGMGPMCMEQSMSTFINAHCPFLCASSSPRCGGAMVALPTDEYAVVVPTCEGCAGKTLTCPGEFGCVINCTLTLDMQPASGSCLGTTIRCGDGPCEVLCDSDNCDETTTIECGTNECLLRRGGSDAVQECGDACNCAGT